MASKRRLLRAPITRGACAAPATCAGGAATFGGTSAGAAAGGAITFGGAPASLTCSGGAPATVCAIDVGAERLRSRWDVMACAGRRIIRLRLPPVLAVSSITTGAAVATGKAGGGGTIIITARAPAQELERVASTL